MKKYLCTDATCETRFNVTSSDLRESMVVTTDWFLGLWTRGNGSRVTSKTKRKVDSHQRMEPFFGSVSFPKKPRGLTLETGAGSGRGAALPANCCAWNLQRKKRTASDKWFSPTLPRISPCSVWTDYTRLFKKGSFCLDCCQISLNKYKLSEIFYTIVKQRCAWFIIIIIIFFSNQLCTDCL